MVDLPTPADHLRREMKTALIRVCGEHQVAYKTEVLDLFAKTAAGVAMQAARRRAVVRSAPVPAPPPPPVPVPVVVVPDLPKGLTLHQVALLGLLAEGLSDERIAARLDVKRYRVKNQLKTLFTALEASGRAQAVAVGYELGLLGAVARMAQAAGAGR